MFTSARNHWVLCLQTESNNLRILSSLENTTEEEDTAEYSCRSSEDCVLLSDETQPSLPFSFRCEAGHCVATTRWRHLEVEQVEEVEEATEQAEGVEVEKEVEEVEEVEVEEGFYLVPEEWKVDTGIPQCGHHHHHSLRVTFKRSPRFWR